MNKWIKAKLLKTGIIIDNTAEESEVMALVKSFKSELVGMNLIRAGDDGDGGYLIPNDLRGVEYCFSPGVDVTATFEQWLANKYNIKSFMADASVNEPPFENKLFDFEKKYLGSSDSKEFVTLSSWVANKLDAQQKTDLILQMDIEGAEFEVLIETPIDILRKFRIMVIEFHDMERIFNRNSLPMVRAIFNKIHSAFAIAHVHPNNCCGIVSSGSIHVPRVFEVTYIRKDRLTNLVNRSNVHLPHLLDTKNVPHKDDITMPEIWWR